MRADPARALEGTQHDMFWVPPGVSVVDRPEIQYLHAQRPVSYLNVVCRTSTTAGLDALVAEVAAAHAHTTSRWMVWDTTPDAVGDSLRRGGYAPRYRHEARITPADASFDADPGGVRIVTTAADLRVAHEVVARAFAQPVDPDADIADELARLTAPAPRTRRYVVWRNGEPVASGGLNAYPSLGIGLLWGGGTVPGARGRGAYRALLSARAVDARRLGLRWIGLYARDTTSAPIVARLGFGWHGTMTYWVRPGQPD